MPINLIEDAWLPVVRRSSARDWIAPAGLAETEGDPPVALDFPRPDWNAAVSEFLIGLLAVAFRPKELEDWAERWQAPPSRDALASALQPLAFAFNLDGDGPRAFQDLDSLASIKAKVVAALLIEAPGENTIKENKDLFNKRGLVEALSPPYAAAALITLQTYAPSGGAGHLTSLRGGGPLTTLVAPRDRIELPPLWTRLWANVPEVAFDALPVPGAAPAAWARVFPWLAPTRTSEKEGRAMTPDDASPLIVFFATPRRIRLEFTPAEGEFCALGGQVSEALVRSYRMQTYGTRYLGLLHPLSPYREHSERGKLPLRPRSSPPSWRDWLGWWGFDECAPEVLRLWESRARAIERRPEDAEVSAVGFELEDATAVAWLEQSIPWVDVNSEDIKITVGKLVDGAQQAASILNLQTKVALYGERRVVDGKVTWRLPKKLPNDALSETADALWAHTERRFRSILRDLAADHTKSFALREGFLPTLRTTALRLFDEAVDMDGLPDKDARRLVVARDALGRAFAWSGKVAKALGVERQSKPREAA